MFTEYTEKCMVVFILEYEMINITKISVSQKEESIQLAYRTYWEIYGYVHTWVWNDKNHKKIMCHRKKKIYNMFT